MSSTACWAFFGCFFLLCFGSSSQAYKKPQGPPTLSHAYITFKVEDDDKDHDSYENITVTVGQYRVGSKDNAGAGVRWPDQQQIAPIYLDNIDKNIEPIDCDKIKVDISHATRGSDNFKFSFTVVLIFTDGSSFTYKHPNKTELTKDRGHGEWEITKSK